MNNPRHRHPAVAGHFYRGAPEALKRQVEALTDRGAERRKVIGALAPHAGLVYSGSVAGAVYSRIELPDAVVLIGPNHTGLGADVSLMASGEWETPLGTVRIDEKLAASILSKSHRIKEDSLAHLHEHSLEVQLPFIQFFKSDCTIVPIQMLDVRFETCMEVGRAVGEAIRECNQQPEAGIQPLVIASSDMTHYENALRAKEKDFKAIQRILDLDPEGLYKTVKDNGITMCGYGPAAAMLVAARMLGATKADLVKYANSGEVSSDYEQVVGYAGIVVQ